MNSQNKRILLGLAVVLILVLSVSTASAWSIKPHFKPTPTPTPLKKCGFFERCPTPTPTPIPVKTPVPTPVPTPIHTPEPTPVITATSIPAYDISITSSSPDTTPESSPFVVNTVIKSTFNSNKVGSFIILVTGLNGQTSYQRYEREIVVKPGTNAETVIIDIAGWGYGDYNVLVTFPGQEGESSLKNNVYEFDMRIPLPPTPTPAPTPIPTPAPIPFDISVTGKIRSQTVTGLEIITTVAHNSVSTIEGKVSVTVNGVTQSKKIVMKHHDTYISDESTSFSFDISGWNDGTYLVTVSFPIRNNEPNTANNQYQFNVVISRPKQPKVDLDLSRLDTVFQYSSVQTKIVGKGEYFWIDYTLVNRGDVTSTGDFTVTSESKTLFKGVSTLKKGETRSGRITLLSSVLPNHAEGYNYLLVGKITTAGDINPKNDIMNVYVFVK